MTDWAERLRAGDPRALPRLLSLVENDPVAGSAALAQLGNDPGDAHVVGITGPPGAGKSTLTDALVRTFRADGRRVAVLAIDPSSPITGGALLGDRIRMSRLHADPGVFVRSMAARGQTGGLSAAAQRAVTVLAAAGFALIVVETVGVGQDATAVRSIAETVVVVQVPGLGDGVQAIKAGPLEVADVFVVNKADLPGAAEYARLLADLARDPGNPGWRPPVILTSATTGTGVDDLAGAIDAHRRWLREHGTPGHAPPSTQTTRSAILSALCVELERRLHESPSSAAAVADAVGAVERGEIDAVGAAVALADLLAGSPQRTG